MDYRMVWNIGLTIINISIMVFTTLEYRRLLSNAQRNMKTLLSEHLELKQKYYDISKKYAELIVREQAITNIASAFREIEIRADLKVDLCDSDIEKIMGTK